MLLLPVFFNGAGSGHFYFFGVLLHGVLFVVFDGFEQTFSILLFLLLLPFLLLLLLAVLLVLLLILVLLLLLFVLLLLLVFLIVLPVVALLVLILVFVLVFVFVVLVLSTALLLLLLLGLLKHFLGIGEIVAGVVVLGSGFKGFLIVVDGLLELLHAFGTVFFLETGFKVAVAAVVKYAAAFFVGEAWLSEGFVEVVDGFVVFLLTVECVAEIVLSPVSVAVLVECTEVVDFGAVVFLGFVFAVAFAGFFPNGAVLRGEKNGQGSGKDKYQE